MSDVVQMFPEPRRAERLLDTASDGGIEAYVHWCKTGTYLLFRLINGTPSEAGMAAMVEMSTRFVSNTDFCEAVEHYSIQLGSAVHNVDETPWVFRPVEPDVAL